MPDEDMLKKQYIVRSDVDTDERSVTAVISTGLVDREDEVLLPKGIDYEQYMKNPTVLWAHDYHGTPIGRTLWIKQGTKKITAKALFAETERAEEVYQLFKGGYLNAFSVGFLPKESHKPEPDEIKKHPEWANAKRIYDKWELLEFSAVPVPANPEALAMAVKTKEIAVSDELQDELGIEAEELECAYMPDEIVLAKTDNAINLTEVIVCTKAIKLEKALIGLARHIPEVEPHIDSDEIAQLIKNRLRGKMFIE